jgi:putative ABC transport system permease protein
VRFTLDDVDRVANSVPGITAYLAPVVENVPVQNDLHTYTWT